MYVFIINEILGGEDDMRGFLLRFGNNMEGFERFGGFFFKKIIVLYGEGVWNKKFWI